MLGLAQKLNRPVFAVLAVAMIAAVPRFTGLSSPDARVFDEFYYSKSACILLGEPNHVCGVQSSDEKYWRKTQWDVGSWVHPPLGKWMIAMGEKLFGADSPFGWRFSSAVAGTLICVMIAGIAQILWGRPIWTFVAGLLASVESLDFVLSRLALLDIFVAFWAVLGFFCLLLDRRWIDRRTPPDEIGGAQVPAPVPAEVPAEVGAEVGAEVPRPRRVPSPVWRPWRFAAGAAFGAAASVKWSGAFAIAGAVLLTYAWETSRRRRPGARRRSSFFRAFAWETFGMLLAFLIIPGAVYVSTWLPWLHHFGWNFSRWWADNQVAAWDYHRSLTWTALDRKTGRYTPTHPYFSHAYTWLAMTRPVSMFAKRYAGTQREILAIGNPVIFWATAWTLPYLGWKWWGRHKDWRAGLVLGAVLAQYLPWFAVSRPQFFFYMSPVSPFLALAAAYAARDLSDMTWILRDEATGAVFESTRHPYRPIAWGLVGLAVGMFWWFYPVLTGAPISIDHWNLIVWFRSWI
ncbi:MAG: phospholipid carrier-dependent glycosyltransferase [Actinobacteria bacterium]|nr:phospholipid carrier-dependent glycosyltransferase [Actinomycetota bacterium]